MESRTDRQRQVLREAPRDLVNPVTLLYYTPDVASAATRAERSLLEEIMVIETFRNQDAKSVYRRFLERGRLMPDGLAFVNSWVQADLGRCVQVMECEDVTLLQRWVAEWSDLIHFEIVPVVPGKDTAAALAGQLA